MPFEYIVPVEYRSPNAGVALTTEMEKRVGEYLHPKQASESVEVDASGGPVLDAGTGRPRRVLFDTWEQMPSPNPHIGVRCMKRPLTSASKIPAVEFTMVVQAPPETCVQFFQDVREQKRHEINPKLEELKPLLRLVRNGQLFADPLMASAPIAINPFQNWFARYKNVSFLYSRHQSLAPSSGMPPIDAINVVAIRPFLEGATPGSWIMMSMSAHADAYKMVPAYTRAEMYISFSIMEPLATAAAGGPDGAVATRLRVVECMSLQGHTPQAIAKVQIPIELDRFQRSTERIFDLEHGEGDEE